MWLRIGVVTELRKPFLQHENRPSFDRDAGQSSTAPGAGVDVDAVGTDVRMGHRRMTKHDDDSMILGRPEKLVANPMQVFGGLLFDPDPGTNAGVYEQKISAAKAVAQT